MLGNVSVSDRAANAVRVMRPVGPSTVIGQVMNAGDFSPSVLIAPGEILVIAGTGLGPAQFTPAKLDANGQAPPAQLAGTSVTFDDLPAPILYTWASQIAVIIPAGVIPGKS